MAGRSLIAVLFLIAPALLHGQGTKVVPGLGVGIDLAEQLVDPDLDIGGFNSNLLVPVMIGRNFRVQPWLGLFRASSSSSSDFLSSESTFRRWTFGLSLHYLFRPQDRLRVFLGGGAGLAWSKAHERASDNQGTSITGEEKRTDRLLQAVAGGEYFFSSRFSLGGQVSLDYLKFGDPERRFTVSPPQPPPPSIPSFDSDLSMTRTQAQISIRWYFDSVE